MMKLGDSSGREMPRPCFEEIACLRALAENLLKFLPFPCVLSQKQNMLITATMDLTDDTIFLKVQIIDNEGTMVLTCYF